jgi:cytochrome P450/NADPH-cytochrome P450 reductase
MSDKKFDEEVMLKRRSALDLLEDYRSSNLPIGDFLAMLPPMRIRQYSISSSPLADAETASITWSVINAPSKTGGEKRFLGVASNYLSNVEAGDRIHVAVKASHGQFHPPNDIEKTPIIMMVSVLMLPPFSEREMLTPNSSVQVQV